MGITLGMRVGVPVGIAVGEAVHRDEHRRGVVAGATAYALWGLLTLYWHALDGIDAFTLIAWRIAGSALLLTAIVAWRRAWVPMRALREPRVLARTTVAALALAANWTIYVWCVTHGRVVDAALGYLLSPIGMVAAGAIVLHEPLRSMQRWALGLAVVSVVVLAAGYGEPPVFAVLIAASWTLYGVMKKRMTFDALTGLTAETWVLLPIALAFLVAQQVWGGGALVGADRADLVLIASAGIATAVPLLLFGYAAGRVPLTTLGWLQYIVPTINLILGVVVYDESMPAWRIAGFAVAWLALVAVSIDGLVGARAAGEIEPAPVPLEG
jgi:chloramphenicol-sensitive protein RarD